MVDTKPEPPDVAEAIDDISEVSYAQHNPEPTEFREAWCETGGHVWQAPKRKGRAPKNCPEHGGVSKPASKPRRSSSTLDGQLKEIEDKLTQILSVPAIPMAATGDAWPAEHISQKAPSLAHEITETARNNPAFRDRLLTLLHGADRANLAVAAVLYLVPVLLYYEILPAGPVVKAQFQVPDRQEIQRVNAEQMAAFMQAQHVQETFQGDNGESTENTSPFPEGSNRPPDAA